jgi:hypothetical protein
VKGAQVLTNYFRHTHAQSCREILQSHLRLVCWILQQGNQTLRQALNISSLEEVDGQTFFHSQFADVENA